MRPLLPYLSTIPLRRSAFSDLRRYHISLSPDINPPTFDSEITQSEDMKRNNLISSRLYRILLRSCRRDVTSADASDFIQEKNWILLKPPFDVRRIGHADVLRGRIGVVDDGVRNLPTCNRAVSSMVEKDVGRALEVLRFVHVSLGGDAEDDLNDYYLGSQSNVEEVDDDGEKDGIMTSSAAGRHSDGHYTNFLDEDEERGEGSSGNLNSERFDSNQDTTVPSDDSVLVTTYDLQNALRIAFRAPLISKFETASQSGSLHSIISRRHRDAISASSLLSDQINAWANKSSICVDERHGVRIVATSWCMAPDGHAKNKYRFSYQIRVENISDKDDAKSVQLLGRMWNIYQCRPYSRSAALTKLFEDGKYVNDGGSCGKSETEEDGIHTLFQTVNEPKSGAVGHFPVIRPGEVFEYMSWAELPTPKGYMEGSFHMAIVDDKTESATMGEKVDALLWKPNDERRFEARVSKFGFVAEKEGE